MKETKSSIFYKLSEWMWKLKWYFYVEIYGIWSTVLQLLDCVNKPTGLTEKPDLVAVVTGGLRGIGLETVTQLLSLGMTVVATFADNRCDKTVLTQLEKEYGGNKIRGSYLDLSSLSSIREFVKEFTETGLQLNVLVCNAGVMFTPFKLTEAGFEPQLGINYLGHVFLTQLLLPQLKACGRAERHSRVVIVTSCIHRVGELNFNDLNSREGYSPEMSYAQSKLALVVYSRYLNGQMTSGGHHVTVNAVHPGVVRTELYQNTKWFHFKELAWPFLLEQPQGAYTSIYAAASTDLEGRGGLYLTNCKEGTPHPYADDPRIQARLWSETCNLLQL